MKLWFYLWGSMLDFSYVFSYYGDLYCLRMCFMSIVVKFAFYYFFFLKLVMSNENFMFFVLSKSILFAWFNLFESELCFDDNTYALLQLNISGFNSLFLIVKHEEISKFENYTAFILFFLLIEHILFKIWKIFEFIFDLLATA